jgi:uncharacterized protein YbbC (DUF1343 family)
MTVTTGLETLIDDPSPWLQPAHRIGLLTNHTGVDRRLRSAVDLIHAHRAIELVRLYGPEHGIRGDAQAGVAVDDAVDARTGLPITSLYAHGRSIADDTFNGIDVLLIDLQDAGVRYYTYLASANSAARRASAAGARVLVLDRPSPIAWMGAFGNRVASGYGSLVGLEEIPIAHGCSIGELLRHLARRDGRAQPEVVPVAGWTREMHWRDTGLPWVPPSPNLPTLDTVHLYPATCLIEGTSLSEGRGTTLPFEQIGDPALDGHQLADALAGTGPAEYLYRAASFVPTFSKHAGELCRGVHIHPDGDHHPSILALGPILLATARRLLGDPFAWVQVGDIPFIDRLAGGPELRETVDTGGDILALMRRWEAETDEFIADVTPDLIYGYGPVRPAPTGDLG